MHYQPEEQAYHVHPVHAGPIAVSSIFVQKSEPNVFANSPILLPSSNLLFCGYEVIMMKPMV